MKIKLGGVAWLAILVGLLCCALAINLATSVHASDITPDEVGRLLIDENIKLRQAVGNLKYFLFVTLVGLAGALLLLITLFVSRSRASEQSRTLTE